jgi:putative endonuclease
LIDFTCGVSYIGCEKEKLGEVAEWLPEGTPTEEGASLGCFMFYVYVLKSQKDGTYYYGSTSNVAKRLRDHNSGKAKFTKGHRPYAVQYLEEYETKREAQARERFFKTIDGYNWLKANRVT